MALENKGERSHAVCIEPYQEDVSFFSSPLLAYPTATRPRCRPKVGVGGVELALRMCRCHVFERVTECPRSCGPLTNVCTGDVGNGLSTQTNTPLRR